MLRCARGSFVLVAVWTVSTLCSAADIEQVVIHRPRTLRDLSFQGPSTSSVVDVQDYLGRLRMLNDRIRFLDLRRVQLQERIADYQRFPRSAVMISEQNAQLQLLQIRQAIRRLRLQRALLQGA